MIICLKFDDFRYRASWLGHGDFEPRSWHRSGIISYIPNIPQLYLHMLAKCVPWLPPGWPSPTAVRGWKHLAIRQAEKKPSPRTYRNNP